MKTWYLLLGLVLLAFVSDEPVSKLNGSYRQLRNKYGSMKTWQARDSVTVIKVFRDGYWLAAFYDDKRGKGASFNGACGGTYTLQGGKYIEKVNFYSWDSTAVGNQFSFDYKVGRKGYEQYGMMQSEKYPNYPINEVNERMDSSVPLKNKTLEGAWFMKEGYWGKQNRFGEGVYKNTEVIKIFSYPLAVYAYYDVAAKKFQGAGGVRYQFDGDSLTEVNEFWSWSPDGSRKGKVEKHKITLNGTSFVQAGWSGGLREVYTKIQ